MLYKCFAGMAGVEAGGELEQDHAQRWPHVVRRWTTVLGRRPVCPVWVTERNNVTRRLEKQFYF